MAFGIQLRCPKCGHYAPDRCFCHGEPRQKAITHKDIEEAAVRDRQAAESKSKQE